MICASLSLLQIMFASATCVRCCDSSSLATASGPHDLGQSTRGRRFYVQKKRQLATGLRFLCRTRTFAMKVSHCIFSRLRRQLTLRESVSLISRSPGGSLRNQFACHPGGGAKVGGVAAGPQLFLCNTVTVIYQKDFSTLSHILFLQIQSLRRYTPLEMTFYGRVILLVSLFL